MLKLHLHALCTTIGGDYIYTTVITYTVFQGTQKDTMAEEVIK